VLQGSAPAGRPVELQLSGRPSLADAGRLRAELLASVEGAAGGWRIDLSGVEVMDGGVAAVIVAARRRAEERELRPEVRGARGPVAEVLALYQAIRPEPVQARPRREGLFLQIGGTTLYLARLAAGVLDYVGKVAHGVGMAPTPCRSCS
jgi:phospholipid/cholesterol/gamma-HCH transport system permease protein